MHIQIRKTWNSKSKSRCKWDTLESKVRLEF